MNFPETPSFSLKNKRALVTGAGRGIGAATAKKLTESGANVLVNDLDEEVAREVAGALPRAVAYPGDLTNLTMGDELVSAAIETFGGLDIVVNNAGYIWHSAIHNMTDEQWDEMIDIHVSAQFRVLRAYGRWLRKVASRESEIRKVVNISSTMGLHGGATQLAYSAGKAAVVGLTRTLAKEWGRFNVTVNAVAFGSVMSASLQGLLKDNSDFRSDIEKHTPIGRIAPASDVAETVQYLASESAGFVTGQILTVDGGRTLIDPVSAPVH